MKKLNLVIKSKGDVEIRPVTLDVVQDAEKKLDIAFSEEYKSYLNSVGVISYGAYETYGLGIPEQSYLNILSATKDFKQDATFPSKAVPLLEIGDGHYYVYDNSTKKVLEWATPNGGVVKALNDSLEDFLLTKIFN